VRICNCFWTSHAIKNWESDFGRFQCPFHEGDHALLIPIQEADFAALECGCLAHECLDGFSIRVGLEA
jgi:hypothetical protein